MGKPGGAATSQTGGNQGRSCEATAAQPAQRPRPARCSRARFLARDKLAGRERHQFTTP